MDLDARRLQIAQERAERLAQARANTAEALAKTEAAIEQAGPGAFFIEPSAFFLRGQLRAIDAELVTTTSAVGVSSVRLTTAGEVLEAIDAEHAARTFYYRTTQRDRWWAFISTQAERNAEAGRQGATCRRAPRRVARPGPTCSLSQGRQARRRGPAPRIAAMARRQDEDPSPTARPVDPFGSSRVVSRPEVLT